MQTTVEAQQRGRSLPGWLPRGGSLPEEVWHARHRGILGVLWAHALVIPIFALIRGYDPGHAVLEGALVPTLAVLGSVGPTRRVRTIVVSVGLLTSSAILVHLSGGVIEMHFHFFVMVAVVALYQDWFPFLAAIAYVLLHHGILGGLEPRSVFNHEAAWNEPWRWAGIHAFFIAGISVACLVNWRLNEKALAERLAVEERLRDESEFSEVLHGVGQALAADLETERVIQTVTDAATALTGARFGAFFYNVVDPESGESFMIYTLSGAPKSAFESFPMPRKTEIFGPTFDGEGVVRIDDVTCDPRFGKMAPHHGMPAGHLPVRSYLAVPVRSRTGEVLGGLFFGHPDVGVFDETDERMVVGIATQATIALDNARLYESERLARTDSETAQAGLRLLADASRVLTSSLEVDAILRGVTSLVAGTLADYCTIDLLEAESSSLVRVAAVAPGVDVEVADVEAHRPDLTVDDHPIVRAIRAGESVVLAPLADELVERIEADPSVREKLRERARGSGVVVPLVGRHEVLGAISLAALPGSARTITEAQLPLAEELARRAALAIENARLYGRQRTVATTLQHSLLPDRLPEIPGFETAVRYLPGADVDVGGDWYDVLQLPGGRIALTMGDVVGRGERAAALMGQLRTAVRAYALDGRTPSQVVERVNAMLLDAGREYMATMIYVVVDADAGEMTFVNAGHPPPVLVGPDGSATFVESAGGMPVGALASARYRETTLALEPGATVLLYTDGLVEERSEPLADGLDRLLSTAAGASTASIDELCGAVLQGNLGARHVADDVALLAFRLGQLGDELHLRLPSQPTVLAPLRATLRRWLVQAGASEQEVFELLVAAGEACSNAVRHATGPAAAHFRIDAVNNGVVDITVSDEGRWRPPRDTEGGRGLSIIAAMVDHVDVTPGEGGTQVRMRRRLLEAAS